MSTGCYSIISPAPAACCSNPEWQEKGGMKKLESLKMSPHLVVEEGRHRAASEVESSS
jgi:hypothetical protein